MMSLTRVVAITGCDSGLGFALAARSAREGLITVAGMLNTESQAARSLAKLEVRPYKLDVTSGESVQGFRSYVDCLLKENPSYSLHAVVNNAGVMTIGEYEWQTTSMIEDTININLLGPMKMAKEFLPLLRRTAVENKTNPRFINIASHCGLHPMPGFAPYSASKAGILAWTHALRLELKSQGLSVVAFIPGGFVGSSMLLSHQAANFDVMLTNLNDEQQLIYGKKITALRNYFQNATQNTKYDSLHDGAIIETFIKALTEDNPKEIYKVESWRYAFYYGLLSLPLPEVIHHFLIKKFLLFPEV